MSFRRVFLDGVDISKRFSSVPNIVVDCGEYGAVTVIPQLTLEGINTSGFWEAQNPASPFYGAPDLSTYPVVVQVGGVTAFSGSILKIDASADTASAQILLRSTLQKALERGCIYSSATDATPSTIAREILRTYQIPIDTASFGAAEAVYTADLVYCNAQYLTPETTVLDVLQRVAEVGCARIYAANGLVHFDLFMPLSHDPIYTFSDAHLGSNRGTLWTPPVDESVEKDSALGYSVSWVGDGGTPVSYGPTTAQPRTIQGGADQALQINTLAAATWIGERWLSYLQTAQARIHFGVPVAIARQLSIGDPVGISYSKGHWAEDKVVDLTSIDVGDGLTGYLVGLTR